MSEQTRPPVTAHVASQQEGFHQAVVSQVKSTVAAHPVVVVGMAWNPFVGKARRLLTAQGQAFEYLGYGNYLMGWKQRLAIKLWSGYPTFPQVFVRGVLIGGCTELQKALEGGQLKEWLEANEPPR